MVRNKVGVGGCGAGGGMRCFLILESGVSVARLDTARHGTRTNIESSQDKSS